MHPLTRIIVPECLITRERSGPKVFSNMAVLGFASEYENKSFYDILNPPSAPCIDFNNEQGFSFPPVADVSINA